MPSKAPYTGTGSLPYVIVGSNFTASLGCEAVQQQGAPGTVIHRAVETGLAALQQSCDTNACPPSPPRPPLRTSSRNNGSSDSRKKGTPALRLGRHRHGGPGRRSHRDKGRDRGDEREEDRDELEEESHNQERSDQVVLTGEIDAKEHLHL